MQVKQLLRKLEAKHPEGLSTAQQFLASEDLLPVKEEEKTWNHWSFVSFWIADSFNLNTFVIASSMISAGLTWYQAFACVIVGYCLVGPLLVLNARPGAIFGLTFPSVCRTTFGVFGSLWPVFNRAVMACVWWGVQAWLGGQCVYVFIRAMAPNFASMKNLMPASSETTSAYVLSFFIYWLLSLPTIWVPIHKLRWLFLVKAIIGPIIGFAFFGWSITRAGGVGPVFSQPATLSGSDLSWQMLISISSCFNNMFTLITNAPDFASRAKTPSAAVWPQLIAMPIGFTITSFMGIMIASASAPQFGGKPIWNVVEILDLMLQNDGSSGTRAGVFFIAAGFIYVQLMLNVAANSISAGCDLTALLPRYINIRRGGYIAALVGIAMNPWLLYKSSATFGNYLGSYGVLLSCIAGPMIADYWIVRRGHYRINDLYTAKKEGWYYYTYGINWRAYAAYLTGFAINAPGFVKSLVPTANVPIGMTRVYTLSWLVGTGVSCAVYVALCYISPPPGMNRHFVEIDESKHEIRFDNDQMEHRSSEEAERSGADEKQASKEKVSQGGEVYVLPA